jgi:uncharacterized protein (TIGR00266 family)
MQSHQVDYKILGHGIQLVEITLDPGETVIAEAGAMNYMEQGISFTTKMGDGSDPDQGVVSKLFSAAKRKLTGESLFTTHFTNTAETPANVAFSAPYPGTIIPLNLNNHGGKVICQKDAFICAALGTKVSMTFNRKLGAGFFGGEGFILQSLEGDGLAFIHAGGTLVKKELNGQTLRVDTGCLVGFTTGIDYNIKMAGNLKSVVFGGEGMFLATLSGHGTVWLQSLPFSRLADRVIESAARLGGKDKGED